MDKPAVGPRAIWSAVAPGGEMKPPTNHVEAFVDRLREAGSIPTAFTFFRNKPFGEPRGCPVEALSHCGAKISVDERAIRWDDFEYSSLCSVIRLTCSNDKTALERGAKVYDSLHARLIAIEEESPKLSSIGESKGNGSLAKRSRWTGSPVLGSSISLSIRKPSFCSCRPNKS
jgi:hypothetical protein